MLALFFSWLVVASLKDGQVLAVVGHDERRHFESDDAVKVFARGAQRRERRGTVKTNIRQH